MYFFLLLDKPVRIFVWVFQTGEVKEIMYFFLLFPFWNWIYKDYSHMLKLLAIWVVNGILLSNCASWRVLSIQKQLMVIILSLWMPIIKWRNWEGQMWWILITCFDFPTISIHLAYQGKKALHWYHALSFIEIICIFWFFWLYIMLEVMTRLLLTLLLLQ